MEFDGVDDIIPPKFELGGLVIFNRAMSKAEIEYLYKHLNEVDLLNYPGFYEIITPDYGIRKEGDKIIVEGRTGFE